MQALHTFVGNFFIACSPFLFAYKSPVLLRSPSTDWGFILPILQNHDALAIIGYEGILHSMIIRSILNGNLFCQSNRQIHVAAIVEEINVHRVLRFVRSGCQLRIKATIDMEPKLIAP